MFERSKTGAWEQLGGCVKCPGHNCEEIIRMEWENIGAFKRCSKVTINKTQVLIECVIDFMGMGKGKRGGRDDSWLFQVWVPRNQAFLWKFGCRNSSGKCSQD